MFIWGPILDGLKVRISTSIKLENHTQIQATCTFGKYFVERKIHHPLRPYLDWIYIEAKPEPL